MTFLLTIWACTGKMPVDTNDSGSTNNADSGGATDTDTGVVEEAETVTIYELQSGTIAEDTWVAVDNVTITGIVQDYGLFVQESGAAENGGIWVYAGTGASSFSVGDNVDVVGWYEEYAGTDEEPWTDSLSEINVGEHAGTSTITAREDDAEPIDATVLPADDFQDIESYEGVLVRLEDLGVTDGDLGFGEWAAGQVVISSIAFDAGHVYEGDTFDSITGVVHYSYGAYKLVPRSEADLVGKSSAVTQAHALGAGDVVLTEMMVDPGADCDDTKDEYLELYNTTSGVIDLEGLLLSSDDKHNGAISSRVLVSPGAYALLIRENPSPCYGVEGDAELELPLVQEGALITLSNDAGTLDSVDTTGWEVTTGASFSSATLDADDNDEATNWCTSTTALGSDFGTPGAANDCS